MPRGHPLGTILELMNATLSAMSADFEALYARTGRPAGSSMNAVRGIVRRIRIELEKRIL